MDILIAALAAALLLALEHYLPYRVMLRRPLPRLAAYILGVMALLAPYTGLLAYWGAWRVLLALWAITVAGGTAVLACHMVDDWLDARSARIEADEILKVLKRDDQNE